MKTDLELLQDYASSGSQPAFAQLAGRHAGWVHAAAMRLVRDAHLADDVTQAVIIVLAHDAAKLISRRSPLNGWLHTVTRYSASHALRDKARREKHERLAATMKNESRPENDAATDQLWIELAPRLDEMVGKLRPQDREALLLRFFQQKSMADVGSAMGISEDAARKRVATAIERLRDLLSRERMVIPIAAITLCLTNKLTHAAPAHVIAACAVPGIGVLQASQSALIAKGAIDMFFITKMKLAVLSVAGIAALAFIGVGTIMLATTFAQQSGGRAGASPAATTAPAFRDSFPVDKANLVSKGTNKYFILVPGYRMSYAHDKATLVISVLNETKLVDGVETRVIEENESDDGKPVEISRNYFAIDKNTNDLYYFGEDVDIYKNGKVDSHEGAWLSGVKGAHFGLMMPGAPKPGDCFQQEVAPGVALDRCEIVSITGEMKTPSGNYTQCVTTNETSGLEVTLGHKTYAPGVGLVQDDEFLLTKIEKP